MLEAGVAMFLLVFIVWWTMFSGKKPEPPTVPRQSAQDGEKREDKLPPSM